VVQQPLPAPAAAAAAAATWRRRWFCSRWVNWPVNLTGQLLAPAPTTCLTSSTASCEMLLVHSYFACLAAAARH
jgi:hypothetical protein